MVMPAVRRDRRDGANDSALETVLQRDRLVVVGALAVIAALAWGFGLVMSPPSPKPAGCLTPATSAHKSRRPQRCGPARLSKKHYMFRNR
jgi:predicted metal-binding membrane protein